jgi:hypothetical protein
MLSPVPRRKWVPRDDQLYYWTPEWQKGERESLAELAQGQRFVAKNVDEAIRWLTGPCETSKEK